MTITADDDRPVTRSLASAAAKKFRKVSAVRDYGVLLALIAITAFIASKSDRVLTGTNLKNLIDQNTSVGIIACAGTLVMIAGGFDLSVGAIYALAGIMTAKIAGDASPIIAIAGGIGIGAVCGVANGFFVTVGRVNPFIATLASSLIFGGVGLLVSGGTLLQATNTTFTALANNHFLGLLWSSWIFIGFALLMGFVLQRTVLGRHIYMVGGNREAARLSGIRVDLVIATTFAISGLASGLAGTLYFTQVGAAQGQAGASLVLAAVAAIVVGGTSITGGVGAIWRTIVGIFFIGIIGNGFNLLGWDPLYQQIIQGSIIMFAVAADVRARGLE